MTLLFSPVVHLSTNITDFEIGELDLTDDGIEAGFDGVDALLEDLAIGFLQLCFDFIDLDLIDLRLSHDGHVRAELRGRHPKGSRRGNDAANDHDDKLQREGEL